MTRNTLRRVEVAVPIYDYEIKDRIRNMFQRLMYDNVNARVMECSGDYKRVEKSEDIVDGQIM